MVSISLEREDLCCMTANVPPGHGSCDMTCHPVTRMPLSEGPPAALSSHAQRELSSGRRKWAFRILFVLCFPRGN